MTSRRQVAGLGLLLLASAAGATAVLLPALAAGLRLLPAAAGARDGAATGAALAALAAVVGLLVAGRLALVGVLLVAHASAAGVRSAHLALALAPATLRPLVSRALAAGALGAAGLLAVAPASGATAGPPLPVLDRSPWTPAAAGAASSGRDAVRSVVVVRPGDSLWALAARDLGPSASPEQVAAAWPRWYAANRAVIGPDPAVIRPGQRLVAPVPHREEQR